MQRLRLKIENLISSWKRGEISEVEVFERAEDLWDQCDEWPSLPDSDPRSIAIEVLSHLSMLNVQLICIQDIETILSFLRTPPGMEISSWNRWRDYWDSIDYRERAQQLKDKDIYLVSQYFQSS